MYMSGLQRLHASMQQAGIDRVAFQIPHNHLTFAGVFLADVTDYELAFGPIGHNLILPFKVDRGYNVLAHLRDDALLQALKDALNLGRGGNAFRFGEFLEQIDDKLGNFPVNTSNVPDYADVIRLYPATEEALKVHYIKLKPHKKHGGNVTPENLAKTRRLLGQTMHDFCKRNNVSSCWSATKPKKPRTPAIPSWPGYK